LQGLACFHLVVVFCASLSTSSVALSAQDQTFLSARTSVRSADKPDHKPADDETIIGKAVEIFPEEIVERMNVHVALCIAFVWIGILGAAPILIHTLEHGFVGPVTKTLMAMCMMMWTALFGGLYLFTNVVLFQSSHFKNIRSLTVVECTYFMSQVITTVGYGDITPAYERGQVFVGIYAVFAFLVVANTMTQMMNVVTAAVSAYKDECSEMAVFNSGVRRPSMMPLCKSLWIFGMFAGTWILFFHFYPGENKTWMEAVYMAIITMATIGFGVITPVTEEGMIFGAFFMLFGAGALAKVVLDFSTFTLELALWERWSPEWLGEHLKDLSLGGDPDNMTEVAFIKYTLIENRLASKEKLDGISKAFQAMASKEKLDGISRKGSVLLDSVDKLVGMTTPRLSARGDAPAEAPAAARSGSGDANDEDQRPESYRHSPQVRQGSK